MGNKSELGTAPGESEFREHRIATFGRKDLAQISLHYTLELLGVEQEQLSKEDVERYELGRRAFGHLAHRKVYMIRKIDVYQTGPGADDIRIKVFEEDKPISTRSASSRGANSRGPQQ